MLRWTWKTLMSEPWQLVASVFAIGSAFVLVLFFEAVFVGESEQIVAYIERSDADVWVMQRGVSNMHMTTSFLADWKGERLKEVEGVSQVTPILYLNTVMEAGQGQWFTFVVGLDDGQARAGPWSVSNGQVLPEPGKILVPSVLAAQSGLVLGDSVSIGGQSFEVSGLTDGTFSMANSVAFVTLSDLSEVMSTFGTVSYFLVDADPGVDPTTLAERIKDEVPKVNAIAAADFSDNDWAVAMQMGLEIIGMMTVIGSALAVLLAGFAVYSHTVRRERELAILKALGFRNVAIYASVLAQSMALVMAGALVSLGMTLILGELTSRLVPQVTLQLTMEASARVFILCLILGVAACTLPSRRILAVDPLLAFRS